MNYSYTLRRVDPKQRLLGVRYHVEGRKDFLKNFNTSDFSTANVERLIAEFAPSVREYWENYDAQSDVAETVVGQEGSGAAEKTVVLARPEYDPALQELQQVESFDAATLTRTVSFTVVDLDAATRLETFINRTAAARLEAESEGLVWTDTATGQVFYLDTTPESQNRFAAARVAIQAGERVDGSVWKLAEVSSGSPVLTFRPTTNAELTEWAGLVHAHVQQCFEAEANTVNKLMAGATTTFADELAALRAEAPAT